MTGFGAFLRKELTEIRRTWRIWVIPGMLVFFGITSPIIAALTPALVQSMATSQPGLVIRIPPPTARDAYVQFIKSLDQLVLIAIIITGASVVSGERSSGTAILALTKPLSRAAFVVTKVLSQTMLLVVATALGTAVCLAVTAVAIWLVYAVLLIVVMTLLSAAFQSRGAAAGAGLGFYFLTLLLSAWGPAARNSFVGLVLATQKALVVESLSLGWPLATAVVAIGAGTVAAVGIFERQEL